MAIPPKKTIAVGVAGVLIAVIPALFTYMQNRDEIKAKYVQTQASASSGYDALASSVKELQKATLAQHDYIVKMQGQLELMEKFVLARTRVGGSGYGSGSGRLAPVTEPKPPELPAPPPKPIYGKMPDNFDAAQIRKNKD